MKKQKQTRRISSEKLRKFFSGMADDICSMQDKVNLTLSGNTFEIHLEGATINISINSNREGGAA